MGAFLGSYRLEKRSKSHGVSENSITTGIPIQTDIRWCSFDFGVLRSVRELARRVSSRQGKLKLSQTVQTQYHHRYPPRHTRSRASGSQNKVA